MNQREIKFRAWDRERNRMLLDLVPFQESRMPSNWARFYDLMQFTGLHDRNGKNIFEKDIVHIGAVDADGLPHAMIGVVEWDSSECAFVVECDGKWPVVMFKFIQWIEVIGNLFETPELLKDK